MILFALVVDSVKLGKSGFEAWDLAVPEESPNLSQGHCERLFGLCSFNLFCVEAIPCFKLRVVAKHDILYFFSNLLGILFKFSEVGDVKKAFERVLFDLFFSGEGGLSFWGMRLNLTLLWWRTFRSDCDDSFDHAIFFEGTVVSSAILKSEQTMPLFEIFEPVTFILTAV